MNTLLIIFLIILFLGIAIFIFLKKREKSFGVLAGKNVYLDTDRQPGEIIYAKDLPLCGKPDYILREENVYLPVEVKTGRTPNEPYQNHVMQLMAYCYLTEEKYGVIIPGGVIKYPSAEFRIQYTDEARESVRAAVRDILNARESREEFACHHDTHNLSN